MNASKIPPINKSFCKPILKQFSSLKILRLLPSRFFFYEKNKLLFLLNPLLVVLLAAILSDTSEDSDSSFLKNDVMDLLTFLSIRGVLSPRGEVY